MVGAIVLILLLFAVTQPILKSFKQKFPFFSIGLMNKLYWYHTLFWGIYFWYSSFNPSDSKHYYFKATTFYDSWFEAYGVDSKFIEFAAYPFAKGLGFSYPAMMVLFAWFGYLGFVHFYIFFKENIKTNPKLWGIELVTLLLFLPNMHFWTVALSKGSIIFFGISMFAYGMRLPQKRLLTLLAGSLVVFNIRPHVFLFLAGGAVIGYFTGREKIPMYQKMLVYVAFIGGTIMFSDQILAMANINLEGEAGVFQSFEEFASDRAANLAESGSGVNINSYPLPLKLVTFWFRPLFFDAPGALGLVVSLENLLYIILVGKLFDRSFIPYIKNATSLVKMSITIFLTASLALAFVMANLGIAMRQKSMVMYFIFFVVLSFLDYKRQVKLKKYALLQKKMEEEQQLVNAHA